MVQAFSDEAIKECPLCQEPVRKIYNSVGVVFKGSGFYKTDSRAAKSDSSSSSTNSTSGGSTSGGSTSTAPASTAPSTSSSSTSTSN